MLNFIAISILQISLYLFVDWLKLRFAKYYLTVLFVLAYWFLIPRLTIPEFLITDEPQCGMPMFAHTFLTWFFGTIATIATYLIYHLFAWCVKGYISSNK